LAAVGITGSGVGRGATSTGDLDHSYGTGEFLIDVRAGKIRVRHRLAPDRTLFESPSNGFFIAAREGTADIREFGQPEGSFRIRDRTAATSTLQYFDTVDTNDTTLTIGGPMSGAGEMRCTLSLTALSEGQLRFNLALSGTDAKRFNRIVVRCASEPNEAIFGLGEQLTYFNQKGKLIPIVVQEHGVGRGQLLLTQAVDAFANDGGGTPFATEAPAPHFITSKLRSLFLEGTQYSTFDFRPRNSIEITTFQPAMTGRILFGTSPLGLIEQYTTFAGRMQSLPAWTDGGAIIGLQGGMNVVRPHYEKLVAAGVPITALWLQDWVGTRKTSAGEQLWWNWHVDESHYPGWTAFVDELALRGARMLIYMNPFLTTSSGHNDLYLTARARGYLVRNRSGKEFAYKNTDFSSAMLDLSNPAARTWIKSVIIGEMLDKAKASGWMADFGEALPFDATLHDGADASLWHNAYPVAWARIHREAIEEAGRSADVLFFNRSGFTQSPGTSRLLWLGDQLQNWSQFDGIKSAVVGMLSAGMSGFSQVHSDTGGYVTLSASLLHSRVPVTQRSKELLMRWVELNAFTSLLRTHEGLDPALSAQVYDDDETVEHFARFSKIYAALAFYRRPLLQAAEKYGHPVVRHPFVHYPNDPAVHALRYQFMLGEDFMVAPVLDPGVRQVYLYLPAGSWTNFWTGHVNASQKGRWTTVAAPIGNPGLFYRTTSPAGNELTERLKQAGVSVDR
jgi:alpha-glucosidase